jgi:hypothetical protein
MIDREAYEAVLECEDTLLRLVGDNPSGLMNVALLAVRETRRELTPTVWTSDVGTIAEAQVRYPNCDCDASGQWGATGRMPYGHVLLRWSGCAYLAHDDSELAD